MKILSYRHVQLFVVIASWASLKPTLVFASEIADTSCDAIGTAVLPIIARPVSIEPVAVDRRLTGLLEAKIPCSQQLKLGVAQLERVFDEHRGPDSIDDAIKEVGALLIGNYEKFDQEFRDLSGDRKIESVRVMSGFVEQFHGFVAVTIVHTVGKQDVRQLKFTAREADVHELPLKISSMLEDDDHKTLAKMRQHAQLIPVAIHSANGEFLDLDPNARRLRHEVHNFLQSRFGTPYPPAFLERRQFFRLASEGESSPYKLDVDFEMTGTRIFATVRASSPQSERTLWVEDDLTNLVRFEEALVSGAQRALAQLEGIVDYSLLVGVDFVGNRERIANLFNLSLRQNRGDLAFTGRVRIGQSQGFGPVAKPQSLILLGGAAGYQPLDWRFLNFDLGIGVDAGIVQFQPEKDAAEDAVYEPNIWVSGNGFAQLTVPLPSSLTFGLRFGIEVPYLVETGEASPAESGDEKKEESLILGDASLGVGYSF